MMIFVCNVLFYFLLKIERFFLKKCLKIAHNLMREKERCGDTGQPTFKKAGGLIVGVKKGATIIHLCTCCVLKLSHT